MAARKMQSLVSDLDDLSLNSMPLTAGTKVTEDNGPC